MTTKIGLARVVIGENEMKAYLIWKDNGESYDCFHEWVSNIFLVSDDFDSDVFARKCWKEAISQQLVRLTQDGAVYRADYNKIDKYILKRLKEEFQELEIYEN